MTYIVRDSKGRDVAGDAVLDDALIAEAERYAGTIIDASTNAVAYVAQAKGAEADLDDEHDDVQGFDSVNAVIEHIKATT